MADVRRFAESGGPVLGICNGFQVLLECGLLPGAMLRNRDLLFHCEMVHLRVERVDTPFTRAASVGQVLRVPVAHGEGNYYAPPEVIDELEADGRVVFRYVDASGAVTGEANPNGSINGIAGITNVARNVVGLMPHPERACQEVVGSADGRVIFESVVGSLAERGAVHAGSR
jgi:phosphoribosylformylglycinamidine synthase